MASVKQLNAFNKRVIKTIVELGAKPYPVTTSPGSTFHWYYIDTKAGKLDITLHEETSSSKIYSIFCCFDDPKKAAEVLSEGNKLNLNHHSGKWNFHISDAGDCIEIFVISLKEII